MEATLTTPELDTARDAARTGAAIVSRHFHRGVEVHRKGPVDLVTAADTESEQAIVDLIRARFPDHAVLAEEAHRDATDAEHLWIVDPLDGTTNFAHGIPHFAVSIAYYRHGRPECGVVHKPIDGTWYEAVRGQGAFVDGRPARVAAHARLDEALVGVGFYYDRGAMMECTLRAIHALFGCNVQGIRRFGTASLDLCHVGIGLYGGFFEYKLSPWDFAAGRLFVEEAGGRVTTCLGDELPVDTCTVAASNGLLHEALLDIVREHVPTGG
ncbi:MAG: inositol monophosphatase family protein [Planctomycetota bacterium]|jgi:myo-inositol-1(or 4)-monophosphatase